MSHERKQRCGTDVSRRARRSVRTARNRLLKVACVLALGIGVAHAAHADDYRIGVLHVERILQQSAPAKAALERIEQEFNSRDTELARVKPPASDSAVDVLASWLVAQAREESAK